jgi:hypothetical protein
MSCGCAGPQIDSCHLREEKQISFARLKLADCRLKYPGRFFCSACDLPNLLKEDVDEPDLRAKLMVPLDAIRCESESCETLVRKIATSAKRLDDFIYSPRMAFPTSFYYLVCFDSWAKSERDRDLAHCLRF